MLIFSTLLLLVPAMDDSTMSLIANVDPIPHLRKKFLAEGFIQLDHNESYMPISGIEKGRHSLYRARTPHTRIKAAPRIHLSDAVAEVPNTVTPDVLMCYLPVGGNNLSVRACDVQGVGSVVPKQVLKCSSRIHPHTVSDILIGSQKAPIDFTGPLDTIREDLINMETPTRVQVTLRPCDGARSDLPDVALDRDHLVFVLLNPAVEAATENFGLVHGKAGNFMNGGLVFLGVDELVNIAGTRNKLATSFQTNVANCNNDGDCSANELVAWTPAGDQQRDWFVGTAKSVIRILS